MKANLLLVIFVTATLVAAHPGRLLADEIDRQYEQGRALFLKGDLGSAALQFEQALRANPQYEKARVFLGLTYFRLSEEAGRKGDRAGAITELRAALRLEPEEGYWHSAIAQLLNEQGDPEGASKECAQAAELSPDDSGLASGCGLKTPEPAEKKSEENQKNEGEAEPNGSMVGVSRPFPTEHEQPYYSEKARIVGLQGVTVLSIVVNAQGTVEQMRVLKALGLGLDQNALRTVRTWKFKPAERNGVPIAVPVKLQLAFRLF